VKVAAYQSTRSSLGPVKYMAPESIGKKRYNEASDAFAFGVLVWETTHRRLPFPDLDTFEVAMGVVDGSLRLKIDDTLVPRALADLMRRCWIAEPKDRPSFGGIVRGLSALMIGDGEIGLARDMLCARAVELLRL